eukprot:TRINITY_DN18313_c0_g1_i1.p1 TRINITY_DN18313_c0_g1~~TRINITY_DN18313_c0_g1_i1.p1  ORF type:complete len:179 (-),score=26.87 TRINITY_DN18313_c0_g1_i1:31-522(-)
MSTQLRDEILGVQIATWIASTTSNAVTPYTRHDPNTGMIDRKRAAVYMRDDVTLMVQSFPVYTSKKAFLEEACCEDLRPITQLEIDHRTVEVKPVGENGAVISYRCTAGTHCGNVDTQNLGTWCKEDGKWMLVSHAQYPTQSNLQSAEQIQNIGYFASPPKIN